MKTEQRDHVLCLIRTLRNEFRELSSKKPNDQVNPFKLKYVNQSIKEANELLKGGKPYSEFESFREEDLPTNSDVLLMLSIYFEILYL